MSRNKPAWESGSAIRVHRPRTPWRLRRELSSAPGAGLQCWPWSSHFPDARKFVPLVESLCRRAQGVVVDNTSARRRRRYVMAMLEPLREALPGACNWPRWAKTPASPPLKHRHPPGDRTRRRVRAAQRPGQPARRGMVASAGHTARELQASGALVGCVRCTSVGSPASRSTLQTQTSSGSVRQHRRILASWSRSSRPSVPDRCFPCGRCNAWAACAGLLFIDQVDMEWLPRARSHGLPISARRGAAGTQLGDAPCARWCFGLARPGRYPRAHYRFRNFDAAGALVPRYRCAGQSAQAAACSACTPIACSRGGVADNAKAIVRRPRDGLLAERTHAGALTPQRELRQSVPPQHRQFAGIRVKPRHHCHCRCASAIAGPAPQGTPLRARRAKAAPASIPRATAAHRAGRATRSRLPRYRWNRCRANKGQTTGPGVPGQQHLDVRSLAPPVGGAQPVTRDSPPKLALAVPVNAAVDAAAPASPRNARRAQVMSLSGERARPSGETAEPRHNRRGIHRQAPMT